MAFRTRQAAEFLGATTENVAKLIIDGKLKAHKHSDGRHWLIEKEDLACFISTNNHYKKKFFSYKPSPGPFLDSYRILKDEVNKIL